MEADGLWKAALSGARLSTALGKRRVKLGVSHISHSPRQRPDLTPEPRQKPGYATAGPPAQAARRPPPLILLKASSMSPVSVFDVSGTFSCPSPL